METHEAYCARHLKIFESEQFVAIGDERLSRALNPGHEAERALGRTRSLPDLLSLKDGSFRLREVKFKLEERLIRKALSQLESGVGWLHQAFRAPHIDRLEIAIALRGRRLRPAELAFLGEPLGNLRRRLWLDGRACRVEAAGGSYPVSALLL